MKYLLACLFVPTLLILLIAVFLVGVLYFVLASLVEQNTAVFK